MVQFNTDAPEPMESKKRTEKKKTGNDVVVEVIPTRPTFVSIEGDVSKVVKYVFVTSESNTRKLIFIQDYMEGIHCIDKVLVDEDAFFEFSTLPGLPDTIEQCSLWDIAVWYKKLHGLERIFSLWGIKKVYHIFSDKYITVHDSLQQYMKQIQETYKNNGDDKQID